MAPVVPPPQVRVALQVHAAQPTFNAARRDPVLSAGQDCLADIRERHGIAERHPSLMQFAIGSRPSIKREEGRRGPGQGVRERRERHIGDVVDLFAGMHAWECR